MAGRYDLVIVGMGSGGMVAAEFAATLGIRVCVVEAERVGGDCLWTGCVPSKALLASARAAHHARNAGAFGVDVGRVSVDTEKVFARIRAVQAEIAATDDNPDRFRAEGLEVRVGEPARVVRPNAVRVGLETLQTRYILLATGSRPAVPPIDGLAEAGPLTSETVFALERAPASFVIVGGGPIAVEMAQAFTRLGVAVTVLEREPRILPRDEPELADRLAALLRAEGVELVLGADVERVEVAGGEKVVHATVDGQARRFAAEEIIVATGRAPNVEGLGLEEVGVRTSKRGVETDGALRTSVETIYACGDVAGRHLFTHSAAFEGVRAVRNMFFPLSASDDVVVPWCTFTDPELAHVGLTSEAAREEHGAGDVELFRRELAHSDRARADGTPEGAIVVVTAKGRVVGAQILAPAAGEMIHELALAVHEKVKLSELGAMIHVYPTLSTEIGRLGGEAAFASAQRYRWLVRSSSD